MTSGLVRSVVLKCGFHSKSFILNAPLVSCPIPVICFGWVCSCTHPERMTGIGQLTRDAFRINDLLWNPYFRPTTTTTTYYFTGQNLAQMGSSFELFRSLDSLDKTKLVFCHLCYIFHYSGLFFNKSVHMFIIFFKWATVQVLLTK